MAQKIVNLKAKVELIATDKHPKHEKGIVYTCGQLVAPKHIEKGFATNVDKKAVEPTEETKAKK